MMLADRLFESPAPEVAVPAQRGPTVFIHGFLGWGERDDIYAAVPYWGLASCDVLAWLRTLGYDCHAASLGALSSAWDRACELYAQLTGGRTDYGVGHSKEYNHSRWGTDYGKPLFEGWGDDKRIDIVAHSFGGATARLFLDILANGRPRELEAAKAAGVKPSPFFEGGRCSWVRSISALAAPHNGTTLVNCSPDLTGSMVRLFTAAAKALGISDFKGLYDFQLDQFGFFRSPGESLPDALARMMGADFLESGDHALSDLSVDSSMALNKTLTLFPGKYYFSYPACRTHFSLLSYDQLPDAGMTPLLMRFCAAMGRWCASETPGGVSIGRDWLPNDGLVNTLSAMYPKGDAFCVHGGGDTAFKAGIWNVMPVRRLDHLAVIGGVFNSGVADTKSFYLDIMKNIDSTY